VLALKGERDVAHIAFSPSGLLLAVASGEGGVNVWDVKTGKKSHGFKGAGWPGQAVRFSGDGRFLAFSEGYVNAISGSGPVGKVSTWDVKSAKRLPPLPDFYSVGYIALSPDGRRVAFSCLKKNLLDSEVVIWDTTKGKLVASAISEPVNGLPTLFGPLAFSPDGKTLACSHCNHFGFRKATVELLDAGKGKSLRPIAAGIDVGAMAWSRAGEKLACGDYDGTVRILSIKAGRIVKTLKGHVGRVVAVAFTDGERRVVSAYADGVVKVWDAESGEVVASRSGPKGKVRSVAVSPEGALVAVAMASGEVTVMKVPTCIETSK
jgi:WD40 repeat protein